MQKVVGSSPIIRFSLRRMFSSAKEGRSAALLSTEARGSFGRTTDLLGKVRTLPSNVRPFGFLDLSSPFTSDSLRVPLEKVPRAAELPTELERAIAKSAGSYRLASCGTARAAG
jgi:hypothetical protein